MLLNDINQEKVKKIRLLVELFNSHWDGYYYIIGMNIVTIKKRNVIFLDKKAYFGNINRKERYGYKIARKLRGKV